MVIIVQLLFSDPIHKECWDIAIFVWVSFNDKSLCQILFHKVILEVMLHQFYVHENVSCLLRNNSAEIIGATAMKHNIIWLDCDNVNCNKCLYKYIYLTWHITASDLPRAISHVTKPLSLPHTAAYWIAEVHHFEQLYRRSLISGTESHSTGSHVLDSSGSDSSNKHFTCIFISGIVPVMSLTRI